MTFFVCLYSMLFCDARLCNVMVQLIHWVISLFGLVLRSAEPLSETAVTHRHQGVIIVSLYMSSNKYYLLLLYFSRKGVMQTYRLADV